MSDVPSRLQAIIAWLRAGYPQGVPSQDYVPLLALLRRQLTEPEIRQVAAGLVPDDVEEPVSRIDAGVEISKVTDELPHNSDIARVRETLERAGWPFDDEPLRAAGTDTSRPTTDEE
ncbi:DUF3349 domain-containing protein [Gordonia sp. VNK21]|uniref:DUF3349 domain-containing protein n=1 Tax=Gordonia sp. VNK21 TaxID=3382483 RepID=UPI0038D4C74B